MYLSDPNTTSVVQLADRSTPSATRPNLSATPNSPAPRGHHLGAPHLGWPNRVKPRTRTAAAGPSPPASATLTFLLPNTVKPPISTLVPAGTTTSMFPNGAMALIITSPWGIAACRRSRSMSPNSANGDVDRWGGQEPVRVMSPKMLTIQRRPGDSAVAAGGGEEQPPRRFQRHGCGRSWWAPSSNR